MSDATIRDEMARCQWRAGDACFFRMYGAGEPIPAYVWAVDIPTRRLELMYGDGDFVWVYFEWAWKP
jgi:hypothetical protein